MRKIDAIVVHCSATRKDIDIDISNVDRWHRARGWKMVGYHYFIKLDGTIQGGRPEKMVGAHVRSHNKETIGICYAGGLDYDNKPADTRTPQQKKSLLILLKSLKKKYPDAIVLGHRDYSPDKNMNGIIEPFEWIKACPCFDVLIEYKHLQ